MTAEKILEIARGEIGTTEFPPKSNNVLYNTAYYGREVHGREYSWCAVFVWWCFKKAEASRLYYGGLKTAYCPTLLQYHKSRGQEVKDYKPGDIIFFNFDGGKSASHVGICESCNGSTITTIDGNTGTGNEANGGAVMRRMRNVRYVIGAYRPDYETEDEMTYEQFSEYMNRWLDERGKKNASVWAVDNLAEAINAGITDGTRPQSFATRQEVALMCFAAKNK